MLKGFGWIPDLPDHRDLHAEHDDVAPILARARRLTEVVSTRPVAVDLRRWCSPIEDQEELGSCTAQAAVGLVEWFQRRAFGKHINMSRLFVYKATRNLLFNTTDPTGDTGADLRTSMKELVLIGAPPEENYPYDIDNFDEEPSAFAYALAKNYSALKYYRVAPGNTPMRHTQLDSLLYTLAGGFPFMFGFTVYDNCPMDAGSGVIPMPTSWSRVLGGHAITAVGYDDNKKMFLIRNSWGAGWGDKGYGWLPYGYVSGGLSDDFWSLVSSSFIDTDLFK